MIKVKCFVKSVTSNLAKDMNTSRDYRYVKEKSAKVRKV